MVLFYDYNIFFLIEDNITLQKQWPDGYMELQTFKDFLQGFFQENDCNFAEHYFRNIDKDNSGKINFREFLLYLSAERSSNPFDRITWLFDLFDIDGSGFIDRKEMVEMFKVPNYMYIDQSSRCNESLKIPRERSRKSKDRQYNGKMNKDKKKINDLHVSTQKAKY
jgi:neurocalcin delta